MKKVTTISMPKLIISGGQSGADLAGNEFARDHSIPTRCYVFDGFKPINPEDLELFQSFERINIKVRSRGDYVSCLRDRTLFNIERADMTLIFVNTPPSQLPRRSGSDLTRTLCRATDKPFAVVYTPDEPDAVVGIVNTLKDIRPTVLNIAGQRTMDRRVVRGLLSDAWSTLERIAATKKENR